MMFSTSSSFYPLHLTFHPGSSLDQERPFHLTVLDENTAIQSVHRTTAPSPFILLVQRGIHRLQPFSDLNIYSKQATVGS